MLEDYYSAINTLEQISNDANKIKNSELPDEMKYDLIFSKRISKKFQEVCQDIGLKFDYYDPDTTYDEDLRAFCHAAEDFVEKLKNLTR